MKNFKILIKIIISIVVFIGITIACQKEVGIQDNFNFELIANMNDTGFLYESENQTISIVQDRVITTNKYFFSFEQIAGTGIFQTPTGITINNDDEEPTEINRNVVLKYIPSTIGEHKIKIKVADLYDNIKYKEFTYMVNYAPFTFLYNTATNLYPINTKSPTTITFIQEGQDNYTFDYFVSNGTGTLFFEDIEIEETTDTELPTGSKILQYLPTTLGEHTITVNAVADDGGERTTELIINVTHVDFTIDASPQGQNVNLNTELPINVTLNSDAENENVTYRIKHEYLDASNTGILKDGEGNELFPNNFSDIDPGNYIYTFESATTGETKIKFIVKDSNDQEKETEIIFNVENVPFTFIGTPTSNDVYINNPVGLNFSLTPDGSTTGITYTLSYAQTNGNGELKDTAGIVIPPGTNDIEVTPGTFSYNFIPQNLGTHNLEFIITDSNGETNTVNIELDAVHVPVTFVVSSVGTMIVGENENVNFVITPQVTTGVSYQMNYILTGGSGELTNGSTIIDTGNFIDVNVGGFSYNYKPTSPGNHNLTFQLRDSNTQLISESITIVVSNNDFVFTAAAEDQSILINSTTNINCNINANVTGNTNYYLSFTRSGANSNLKLNSTNLAVGVETTITTGAFILEHEPLEIGTTIYEISVRDDLGNSELRTIEIEAAQLDFNLTITPPQTAYLNQNNTVTFALVPTGDYTGITYQMSYDVENPQIGNFVGQDEGVPFSVTPVSFNLDYIPTTAGTHTIEFTIIDSNLLEHTYNETIEVNAPDFNVYCSNLSDLYVNQSQDFNTNLVQVTTDTNITYQVRYTISGTGNGDVLKNEIVLNGWNTIIANAIQDVTFNGTAAGSVNILTEIRETGNDATIKSCSTNLEVLDYQITFIGAPQNNNIEINQNTNINFTITEIPTLGNNYNLSYTYQNGSNGIIALSNGGIQINTITPISVTTGTFNWNFEGTQIGTQVVNFVLTDLSSGQTYLQSININVGSVPFCDPTITASATDNQEYVDQSVVINIQPVSGNNCQGTYNMFFTVANGQNGEFTFNGVTNGPNVPFTNIDISSGFISGNYKGLSAGMHNIEFTIINSQNNSQDVSDQINIEFIASGLNINIESQDNEIFVLDTASFDMSVVPQSSDNITLKVIPENNNLLQSTLKVNGSTNLFNNDIINISSNFTIEIIPTQLGNENFVVEVTRNGTLTNLVINVISNQPIFTISANLNDNEIWSDQSTTLNVNVNPVNYNHIIDYTYEYGLININTNAVTYNENPSMRSFSIDGNNHIGNQYVYVTVTNEYGYHETLLNNLSLLIKDFKPSASSLNINTNGDNHTLSRSYSANGGGGGWGLNYYEIALDLVNLNEGRSTISHFNIDFKYYDENNNEQHNIEDYILYSGNSINTTIRSTGVLIDSNGNVYQNGKNLVHNQSGSAANYYWRFTSGGLPEYQGGSYENFSMFRNLNYTSPNGSYNQLSIEIVDNANNTTTYVLNLNHYWGNYIIN